MTSVFGENELEAISPAGVIEDLQEGNARYVAGALTSRDHLAQLPDAVGGQYPKAIVLSCVDSRVVVESIFDCGIGDVFVARVAGNQINADILGSMEYACHVAGSKAVVVLGHQHCGAVKSAVDRVELGNITELLSKITPAVDATSSDGERSSSNADFVADVTVTNVHNALNGIREHSPILNQMEADGEIVLVGAVYSLETGAVAFLSNDT